MSEPLARALSHHISIDGDRIEAVWVYSATQGRTITLAEMDALSSDVSPIEFDERLEYERRILRAECGTQRILNELVEWLDRHTRYARFTPDALDPKAAEILGNIAKHVREIDVCAEPTTEGAGSASVGGEGKCGALSYQGQEPQDCNWPYCGCDAKATEVLQALDEHGYDLVDRHEKPAPMPDLREIILGVIKSHRTTGESEEVKARDIATAIHQALAQPTPAKGAEGE